MKRKPVILIISIVLIIAFAISYLVLNNKNGKNVAIQPSATATAQVQNTPAVTLSPAASPVITPSGTQAQPVKETYKNEIIKELNISFKIPEDWQKNTNYENRYEGKSGFFELTTLSGYGLNITEAADILVNHALKPYGDKPEIKNRTVDSQEAVSITPVSPVANGTVPLYTVLIKLPKAIVISSTPYYYLAVSADKEHINTIIEELKFNR